MPGVHVIAPCIADSMCCLFCSNRESQICLSSLCIRVNLGCLIVLEHWGTSLSLRCAVLPAFLFDDSLLCEHKAAWWSLLVGRSLSFSQKAGDMRPESRLEVDQRVLIFFFFWEDAIKLLHIQSCFLATIHIKQCLISLPLYVQECRDLAHSIYGYHWQNKKEPGFCWRRFELFFIDHAATHSIALPFILLETPLKQEWGSKKMRML